MKIKIDGKLLPRTWDNVTFGQSLKLTKAKDNADTLSAFVGIEAETLRKSTAIINLDEALERIKFLDMTEMPLNIPKSINGYIIPKNLEFKSICRYEDLKSLVQKVLPKKEGEKLTGDQLAYYAEMVGVYAMPDYENATQTERDQFAKQFLNAPCGEVMAIGNFTLRRYFELKIPGSRIFRIVSTPMHKLKLVLKSWLVSLVFSVRYATWRRRHRIKEMNS